MGRSSTRSLFQPAKHRAKTSKRSVRAVAKAVLSVMQNELGEGALARWPGLIDAALGQVLFASLNVPKRSPVSRGRTRGT